MASEGPSDDGLLEGVHAASARAAVRRRVLVSSAAAAALVVAGIGVVSATGSDGRHVRDQVVGSSGQPTSGTSGSPDGRYRGRAVTAQGRPVPGLYVYALPQGFREVTAFHQWLADHRQTTRTGADGTFALPCPSGPVLLTSWPFHLAQDASTPNWAAVFVGGTTAPGNSTVPACRNKVDNVEVSPGGVIEGKVTGPGLPCPSTSNLVSVFGTNENSIYALVLSNAWTHEARDGAFRVVGLPVGSYWVAAFNRADPQEDRATGYARTRVQVTGPGTYRVDLTPTRGGEKSTC
jgi:hypothetical protein